MTKQIIEPQRMIPAEQEALPELPMMRMGSLVEHWIGGRTIGLLISTAILFTVLSFCSPNFLKTYTLFINSRWIAFYAIVALAQALCLVVGGMNLSVGAIGSSATVILGICMDADRGLGMNGWAGVPTALLFGCIAGAINGLLITKLKIDSFVITLSMMFLYMGCRSGVSEGRPYALPDSFTFIGQQSFLGVPYVFIIAVVVLILVAYMFTSTVFGRRLLATGGNADAARLSGINTDAMIVWANTISGFFAALAAVLWASQAGSAAPETGDNWLLVSFAVAIIGGTGLTGGVISAMGIFMGAIIYQLINYGLVSTGIISQVTGLTSTRVSYFFNSFLGALILLTIIIDRLREVYGERRKRSGSRI